MTLDALKAARARYEQALSEALAEEKHGHTVQLGRCRACAAQQTLRLALETLLEAVRVEERARLR